MKDNQIINEIVHNLEPKNCKYLKLEHSKNELGYKTIAFNTLCSIVHNEATIPCPYYNKQYECDNYEPN